MKGKNNKVNFTPTPFPFLDLPDYDWEKQYKEDCEFIRNMSDEYKKDEKDYGEFFIPKVVYVPTKMPKTMEEMFSESKNELNSKLDNIQMGVNKILLQGVYNNYLLLIESAKSRKDEILEKEFTEKAEDVLQKIKLLEEGKLK
nr:MAG TPA: hypothetical protein [Caudoviricetes sp.]